MKRKPYKIELDALAIKQGKFRGWGKAELLTWLALKAHEGRHTKQAYPSEATIGYMMGLRQPEVCRAIEKLRLRGELLVSKRRSRRSTYNVYTLLR